MALAHPRAEYNCVTISSKHFYRRAKTLQQTIQRRSAPQRLRRSWFNARPAGQNSISAERSHALACPAVFYERVGPRKTYDQSLILFMVEYQMRSLSLHSHIAVCSLLAYSYIITSPLQGWLLETCFKSTVCSHVVYASIPIKTTAPLKKKKKKRSRRKFI